MILDLFAGPGGWDVGLSQLDSSLETVGVEFDRHVIETRNAAGFTSIFADVSQLDPAGLEIDGLIASPPCQDWSSAGKGARLDSLRGQLVTEVPRFVDAARPRWIACEQVRQVAPVWEVYARNFRALGYWTWSGVLMGADYGLPQRRPRAILIAHRDRPVAPPRPTHNEHGRYGLPRWRPAIDALEPDGLDGHKLEQLYLDGVHSRGSGMARRWGRGTIYPTLRTAPTVISTAALWDLVTRDGEVVRQLRLTEMAKLQGFPDNFPLHPARTHAAQQIADAVPPPLARAVLTSVLDPA